ncbi:hypothetical protein F5148DRAFT_45991 [Russula earlei]|uniref:Uncharacterized protein n=1 Tax=Russula earlei TaxID=71964 RepID=A0ACC0UA01_9AGAM|nr:hypothetical protein F5148DRAFT_45991 [Russula earlei]
MRACISRSEACHVGASERCTSWKRRVARRCWNDIVAYLRFIFMRIREREQSGVMRWPAGTEAVGKCLDGWERKGALDFLWSGARGTSQPLSRRRCQCMARWGHFPSRNASPEDVFGTMGINTSTKGDATLPPASRSHKECALISGRRNLSLDSVTLDRSFFTCLTPERMEKISDGRKRFDGRGRLGNVIGVPGPSDGPTAGGPSSS